MYFTFFFFLTKTDDCTTVGKCVGSFLTEVRASSINDCRIKCQTYGGVDLNGDGESDVFCTWFTYDSLIEGCELLGSCAQTTDSCSDCVSGSVNCDTRLPNSDNGKTSLKATKNVKYNCAFLEAFQSIT